MKNRDKLKENSIVLDDRDGVKENSAVLSERDGLKENRAVSGNRDNPEENSVVLSDREAKMYRDSVPALLFWYDYNARILPWRQDPTPYHVWISEIMLQQTRVEAVRGYYDRFLTEFPTVAAVAEAAEDRLVKLWEGLGYYSRVRNIAKAAKVLCERHGGRLPADYASLRGLPGIGDYTAGAIASIAFGLPVPAVDGNVLRVYARLTAYRDDIRSELFKTRVRKMLTAAMEEAFSDACEERAAATGEGTQLCELRGGGGVQGGMAGGPGQFNQAIMDVGATICIPNGKPHCDVCPLAHLCAAYAGDLTEEIPKKAEKKTRPIQRKTVVVISYNGRILLHRRPQSGLLAGMWELPNVDGSLSAAGVKKAASEILSEAGFDAEYKLCAHRLDDSRHVFSHVEWEMRGYRVEVTKEEAGLSLKKGEGYILPVSVESVEFAQSNSVKNDEYNWFTPGEIADKVGLPQAFHAYKLQL